MARQRVIRYDINQYITLKNFSEEEADLIKKKIFGEATPDKVEEEAAKELPNIALGTFKDGNYWKIAIIKFDPKTGEAIIEKTDIVGEQKFYATERFKLLAIENNFV